MRRQRQRRFHKQGDIYWYDFGNEKVEGKQNGVHPCLIVSNDVFNRYSPVVDIIAISSKEKESPVHVPILCCPQVAGSFAYCEQWVTASKNKVTEYIGSVSDETLNKVLDRLVFQLLHKTRAGHIKRFGGEIK